MGLIETPSEQTELISSTMSATYTYYLTKKFEIKYNEIGNKLEIPKSIEKFVENVKNSVLYVGITKENTQLKQEVERLKPFETYYNMQMELNKAKKS